MFSISSFFHCPFPGGSEGLAAPKASTIAQLAAGGACEAYPLCRASAENGQVCDLLDVGAQMLFWTINSSHPRLAKA